MSERNSMAKKLRTRRNKYNKYKDSEVVVNGRL